MGDTKTSERILNRRKSRIGSFSYIELCVVSQQGKESYQVIYRGALTVYCGDYNMYPSPRTALFEMERFTILVPQAKCTALSSTRHSCHFIICTSPLNFFQANFPVYL